VGIRNAEGFASPVGGETAEQRGKKVDSSIDGSGVFQANKNSFFQTYEFFL
jgi:hypothetical protein